MDGCLPLLDGFIATPYRFLWHPDTRTAIASDLHLGGETELARQGIYLPAVAALKLRANWSALVRLIDESKEKSRLIFAGDIFDTSTPDPDAIAFFRELLAQLPAACAITILPGNHDPAPAAFAQIAADFHFEVDFQPALDVAGYAVFHGHQSADAVGIGTVNGHTPKGIIVGHQHPSITLATRVHRAKMICFATATLHHGTARIALILLPAFSPLPLGSDLRTDRQWILDFPRPLDRDIRIAGIVESTEDRPAAVLDFGPLSELP